MVYIRPAGLIFALKMTKRKASLWYIKRFEGYFRTQKSQAKILVKRDHERWWFPNKTIKSVRWKTPLPWRYTSRLKREAWNAKREMRELFRKSIVPCIVQEQHVDNYSESSTRNNFIYTYVKTKIFTKIDKWLLPLALFKPLRIYLEIRFYISYLLGSLQIVRKLEKWKWREELAWR